jgi:hypothetical protein
MEYALLNKTFPAFMRPTRSTRRRVAEYCHFGSYQRLAAIYLLRLALGLQKSLRPILLLRLFEQDVGTLTGLDEYLTDNENDETGQDESKIKISFSKCSKPELLKCIRRQLHDLMAEGIDAKMPLFS